MPAGLAAYSYVVALAFRAAVPVAEINPHTCRDIHTNTRAYYSFKLQNCCIP